MGAQPLPRRHTGRAYCHATAAKRTRFFATPVVLVWSSNTISVVTFLPGTSGRVNEYVPKGDFDVLRTSALAGQSSQKSVLQMHFFRAHHRNVPPLPSIQKPKSQHVAAQPPERRVENWRQGSGGFAFFDSGFRPEPGIVLAAPPMI